MTSFRLLTLFFFLISLTSFGQVKDTTLIGIQIPKHQETILTILNEFKWESRKRGVFVDHLIAQDLGGIVVMSKAEMFLLTKKFNAIGVTYRLHQNDVLGFWYSTPMIGIREDVFNNLLLTKIVLYHELGHFFGLDHLCCDKLLLFEHHIMVSTLTNVYKAGPVITLNAMNDYFDAIESLARNKRMKKHSNSF